MVSGEHGLNSAVNLVVMSSVGTNGGGGLRDIGTAGIGGSRTGGRGAGMEGGGSDALSFRRE